MTIYNWCAISNVAELFLGIEGKGKGKEKEKEKEKEKKLVGKRESFFWLQA